MLQLIAAVAHHAEALVGEGGDLLEPGGQDEGRETHPEGVVLTDPGGSVGQGRCPRGDVETGGERSALFHHGLRERGKPVARLLGTGLHLLSDPLRLSGGVTRGAHGVLKMEGSVLRWNLR